MEIIYLNFYYSSQFCAAIELQRGTLRTAARGSQSHHGLQKESSNPVMPAPPEAHASNPMAKNPQFLSDDPGAF